MQIIEQRYEINWMYNDREFTKQYIYNSIEDAARTCYRSEGKKTDTSAGRMIKALIKGGHEAMLEHASLSVRFCTDRAITHELVRHRLAAFAQESQRYVNYSDDKYGSEIQYVSIDGLLKTDPKLADKEEYIPLILGEWIDACEDAERHYLKMIEFGASPQIARSVLNNSTRTEIVVTANMREWRHILKLRAAGTTGAPHPAMAALMKPLLAELKEVMPELFEDIEG